MRWSQEEEKRLIELYADRSIKFEKIAELMKRSVPALSHRVAKLQLNRRMPFKYTHPEKMTPALARIHAHVCGDGCIYVSRKSDAYGPWAKYRKKLFRVEYRTKYSNNNLELLKEFKDDIKCVFGLDGDKIYRNEAQVRSTRIYKFLKSMGAGKSREWYIPELILDASKVVKKNWIRAFFDDEAYFNDGGRIRVKCNNKKGLLQLTQMLQEFVPCNFNPKTGSYWGGTYCISINKRNAPNYFRKIGSIRYKPT